MKIDIYESNDSYDLILADPPWKQSKGGKKAVRENSSGKEHIDIEEIIRIKHEYNKTRSYKHGNKKI